MRATVAIAALLLLAGCNRGPGFWMVQVGTNQLKPAVPLTSEPSHHLVLSNDYVRVFRVEAAPGASTLVHRHDNDYFWVAIGASDITNSVVGKPPAHAQVADGEVRFVPGGFDHSVTNNSKQPFRNFTIEVLQHGSRTLKPGEDEHEMTLLQNGSIERLLLRDGVRVSEVELKPGAEFKREKPGSRLIIAFSGDVQVSGSWTISEERSRNGLSGKGKGEGYLYHVRPGFETHWQLAHPGFESFHNTGPTPARLLILDF